MPQPTRMWIVAKQNIVGKCHSEAWLYLIWTDDDPFSTHIANVKETQLEQKIKDVKEGKYHIATSTLQSGLLCLSGIPQSSKLHTDLSVAISQRFEDIFVSHLLHSPSAMLRFCTAQAETQGAGWKTTR